MQARLDRLGKVSKHRVVPVAAMALSPLVAYGLVFRRALTLEGVIGLLSLLTPPWLMLLVAIVSGWFKSVVPPFEAGLTIADVALGLFVLRTVFRSALFITQRRLPHAPYWAIAFFAWAWFAMYLNSGSNVAALGRVTLYGAAFVCASITAGLSRKLFIAASITVLIQMVLTVAGLADRYGVATVGLVGDPHQFGVLCMAGLAGAQFIERRRTRRMLGFVAIVGIVLSLRRGIWIAGIIEAAILFLPVMRSPRGRTRLVVGLLVGMLLALGVYRAQETLTPRLGLNVGSLDLRKESWVSAIALIRDEPWIGSGWSVTPAEGEQPPYNLWLNTAASVGIPGALVLAAFFLVMVADFAQRGDPRSRAVLAFLLGFMALSVSEMTFYASSPATIAFFLLLGGALGDSRAEVPAETARQLASPSF